MPLSNVVEEEECTIYSCCCRCSMIMQTCTRTTIQYNKYESGWNIHRWKTKAVDRRWDRERGKAEHGGVRTSYMHEWELWSVLAPKVVKNISPIDYKQPLKEGKELYRKEKKNLLPVLFPERRLLFYFLGFPSVPAPSSFLLRRVDFAP